MKFDYYEDDEGNIPFEAFLDTLPAKDAAKMRWVIQSTETLGLEIAKRQEWIKKIGNNLFELRSIQGNDIQRGLYFKFESGRFIITHGFTKKTPKTPQKEILKAENIRSKFGSTKRGGKNGFYNR